MHESNSSIDHVLSIGCLQNIARGSQNGWKSRYFVSECKSSKKHRFSPELIALSYEVKRLYKRYRATMNQQDNLIYKKQVRLYHIEIQKEIKQTNVNSIKRSTNKGKTAWAIINKFKKCLSIASICIKHNGSLITSGSAVADIFNTHFKEVLTTDSGSKSTQNVRMTAEASDNSYNHNCNIFLKPIDKKEYYEIISKITKKKSAGYDEVPANILKHASVYLMMPLIFLINMSFETGVFPEVLKKAIISPAFKSGDKEHVGNYRPISNLSVFSKLFENAFCNRLLNYLDKFDYLDNCQHGFRKHRSTSTAVSNFVNQLMAEDGKERRLWCLLRLHQSL
jgi:hypothetical protein